MYSTTCALSAWALRGRRVDRCRNWWFDATGLNTDVCGELQIRLGMSGSWALLVNSPRGLMTSSELNFNHMLVLPGFVRRSTRAVAREDMKFAACGVPVSAYAVSSRYRLRGLSISVHTCDHGSLVCVSHSLACSSFRILPLLYKHIENRSAEVENIFQISRHQGQADVNPSPGTQQVANANICPSDLNCASVCALSKHSFALMFD